MDKELNQKLGMLGKLIPQSLKRKGTEVFKPLEEQKEQLEQTLKKGVNASGHTSVYNKLGKEAREKIEKVLESGFMDKEEERINPKVANQIERLMTEKIKALRSKGELPSIKETIKLREEFMKSRKGR